MLRVLPTYVLARMNMNWQEVFAIFEDEGELCCIFQMALHPLDTSSLMRNYFEMTPPEIPIIVYHHEGDVYVHSFDPSNESVFLEWAESVGLEMDDETYDCFDDYLVSVRKIGGWGNFGEGTALPKPLPKIFG